MPLSLKDQEWAEMQVFYWNCPHHRYDGDHGRARRDALRKWVHGQLNKSQLNDVKRLFTLGNPDQNDNHPA